MNKITFSLFLWVFVFSCVFGFAQDKGQSVTGKEVTESPSAMYAARVVMVKDSSRDAFLKCMRGDLKIRQELKRKGLLSEQSVFETTSTNINTPGAPFWNFLILTRLGATARSDRKSTRLNSSHSQISYAVFCLKKKKKKKKQT